MYMWIPHCAGAGIKLRRLVVVPLWPALAYFADDDELSSRAANGG